MKNFLIKLKSLLTLRNYLIFLFSFFIFLFITQGDPFIRSDAYCYYNIAKAIVNEGRILPLEKPEYFDYMGHVKDINRPGFAISCGPATGVLMAPGILIAKVFDSGKTITNDFFKAYNGHSFAEGILTLLTSSIFGFFAIILIYKTLRKLGYSEKISMVTSFVSFICSYAVWYAFITPSFTHIYEYFAVALGIFGLVSYQTSVQRPASSDRFYILISGFAFALATALRPPNAIIFGVVFLYLIYKRKFKDIVYYLIGSIPFLAVLLIYNLNSSYFGNIQQTGFTNIHFNLLNVLFSPERGFFVYAPIFALGILGLYLARKKYKYLGVIAVTSLLLIAIVYGSYIAWWGGGGFGARYLFSTTPLLTIGIAEVIKRIKDENLKPKSERLGTFSILVFRFSVFGFILYGFLMAGFYRITPVARLKPTEDVVGGMTSGDRYTPLDIFTYHAIKLFTSPNPAQYFQSLYKGINGGSGLMTVLTGVIDYVGLVEETNTGFNLTFFKPPIVSQAFPTQTKFLLLDTQKKSIYEIILNLDNVDIKASIEFECFSGCISSKIISVKKLGEYPETIEAKNYTGFEMQDKNLMLFFANGENIQYKGKLLTFEEDGTYKI